MTQFATAAGGQSEFRLGLLQLGADRKQIDRIHTALDDLSIASARSIDAVSSVKKRRTKIVPDRYRKNRSLLGKEGRPAGRERKEAMRLGIFARTNWSPAVKALPVDQQSQADFWEAKAAAAEEQVRHVKDPLAMDSWLMIADSCRQLAGQFRELEQQHSGKSSKL